ncbi:MAG: M1 family aminopeptidase, partial [Lysobacter sp.]
MRSQHHVQHLGLVWWLLIAMMAPSATVAATNGIDVIHYTAHLEPDLATQRVRGQVTLDLRMTAGGQNTIVLDRGELVVDSVHEAGQPLSFRADGKTLLITLARPARVGERHEIEIHYRGAPRYGLEFHPERAQVYTIFSTSQWLPAVDAPGDRATLALDVVLPIGLKAIGNGRALRVRTMDGDRELHRWRQEVPSPSYAFGFAAGRFTQVDVRGRGTSLSYLGDGFSEQELHRVFANTGDMVAWFAQRAGVGYPGARYSQALVAETIGQELAGFALMSEAHGRRVLAEPSDQALIAHEAAHQWWGNGVTCANWNHFWLNEGFANFMAAAYLQHRFGDEPYRKLGDGWRKRIERLRA